MTVQEDIFASPWISKKKAREYMLRNNWPDKVINAWFDNKQPISFNKKKMKQYMIKTYAPRYSFIIDYFFSGNYSYFLAINVNKRKAFSKQALTRTADEAVTLLNELLQFTDINHILCDYESAFRSETFLNECNRLGININFYTKNNLRDITATRDKYRGLHSALGIMDRLCRTLRHMNYQIYDTDIITPEHMILLIQEYNDSPHTTLSKIFGEPTSPNQMTNEHEDFLVQEAMKSNFITKTKRDYDVVGRFVKCINEAGKFDKVKPPILPYTWFVIGKENGLFKCVNEHNHMILLPRYMIEVI